jgi:hypothetical protein
MVGKRGASNWSVWKLLSLILLVIVLVLVVWGISTGGLNPLFEKAEGMYNEVLILFSLRDGGDGGGLIEVKLSSFDDAVGMLSGIGMSEQEIKNSTFKVSRKDGCGIDFPSRIGSYKLDEGVFYEWEDRSGNYRLAEDCAGRGDPNPGYVLTADDCCGVERPDWCQVGGSGSDESYWESLSNEGKIYKFLKLKCR